MMRRAATPMGRVPAVGAAAVALLLAPSFGSFGPSAQAADSPPAFQPWPGGQDVSLADQADALGGNLSGLAWQAASGDRPAVLWAVRDDPGQLHRLVLDGDRWTPDDGWTAGRRLAYPDAAGSPDSEAVTLDRTGAVYVGAERDGRDPSASRNSVLRFELGDPDAPAAGDGPLIATDEWDLTALLPAVAANTGIEALAWVPDDALVAAGFIDQRSGGLYQPASSPAHGDGLFFVGLEATGAIYAVLLDHENGSATRLATVDSGLAAVMELSFDASEGQLWALCDDHCEGRSTVFALGGTAAGLAPVAAYERPDDMENLNNEGLAISTTAECRDGVRAVIWADDAATDGHALRRGTLPCAATSGTVDTSTEPPTPTTAGSAATPQTSDGVTGGPTDDGRTGGVPAWVLLSVGAGGAVAVALAAAVLRSGRKRRP